MSDFRRGSLITGFLVLAGIAGSPAAAGETGAEGCFFEASYLEAHIQGTTREARQAAAEKQAAGIRVAQAQPANHSDDINSGEEALAKSGMCVYPPGYIDTLAQGSMAPSKGAEPEVQAPVVAIVTVGERIARVLSVRQIAGDMTALPVPLSTLIEGNSTGS